MPGIASLTSNPIQKGFKETTEFPALKKRGHYHLPWLYGLIISVSLNAYSLSETRKLSHDNGYAIRQWFILMRSGANHLKMTDYLMESYKKVTGFLGFLLPLNILIMFK
ncbi:MAG: hypothetical protein ACD_73C00197G0002 [uncultured bacterium]|nr:MAG: hypothetical protein ACD_73C00197G0002 [uncultured bacterium]